MRSRADEVHVVAVDFVDQQPVRFDVAVAEVLPLAAERVVLVSRRRFPRLAAGSAGRDKGLT